MDDERVQGTKSAPRARDSIVALRAPKFLNVALGLVLSAYI